MAAPYSRFYALRVIEYSQFFQRLSLPKHLKILLKSMLHFSVYIVPYMFLNLCILIILSLLSMQFFRPDVFLNEAIKDQTQIDIFLRYLATSLQLLLVNNWGEVMSRCIAYYGAYVSIFFIIPAVMIKFFFENIMLSLFLHTYSETYWEYIKVQDNRIGINFEKRGLHRKNAIAGDQKFNPPSKKSKSNMFSLETIKKLVQQSRLGSPIRKPALYPALKTPSSVAKSATPTNNPSKTPKKQQFANRMIAQLEGEYIDPLKSDYCEFIQDFDTLGLPSIRTRVQLETSKSFFDKPDNSDLESEKNESDLRIINQLENIGAKNDKQPNKLDNILAPISKPLSIKHLPEGFRQLADRRMSSMEKMKQDKASFLQVIPVGPIKPALKTRTRTMKEDSPKDRSSPVSSQESPKQENRRWIEEIEKKAPGVQSPRSGVEFKRKIGDQLLDLKPQMLKDLSVSPRGHPLETETTRHLMTEENKDEQSSSAGKGQVGALLSPREYELEESPTSSAPSLTFHAAGTQSLRGFRKKSAVVPVSHSSLSHNT
jgi:Ion transport protein